MYGYKIFHNELMQNLIDSVHRGASSHAYIFEGDKGLRIRDAARLFAAALTCRDKDIAPCGACPSCAEANADTNPDIIYVNSGDKKSIGADKMRELEEDAAIKPFAAARKVYIIEDGEQLTEAAQNVFLKTFEEPPEYAVFIIITENSQLLLQTILSRFTLIHFPRVSDKRIEFYIKKKYPEETERLPFLVKYCDGIPETADNIINNENFETLRYASLEKLSSLLSSNRKDAFIIEKFIEENKDNLSDILNFWLSFLRDITLIQTGAIDKIINIDKKDTLRQISSRINPKQTIELSEKVITSQKMTKKFVNFKSISFWLSLKQM